MASSSAATVADYLGELAPDRRVEIAAVRDAVNVALPAGYREVMSFGMIGWVIPLDDYPGTYNGQPLAYAGLAAQKNGFSLYLNGLYASSERAERFKAAWSAPRKLDMGKSCLRFRRAADLDLALIAAEIAAIPPADFIAHYERIRPPKR